MNTDHERGEGFLGSRWSLVLIGFSLIAGFFLITEHTAHVLGALPYLLLLACPLMHLFGHHGHHSHGGDKTVQGGERKCSDKAEGPPRHAH